MAVYDEKKLEEMSYDDFISFLETFETNKKSEYDYLVIKHKDLLGMFISKVILRSVQFISCNLSGVTFEDSYIVGSSFINCNMQNCVIDKTILKEVCFIHSDLTEAIFSFIEFKDRVYFRQGTNLTNCKLLYYNNTFEHPKSLIFDSTTFGIDTLPMACPKEGEFIGYKKCQYRYGLFKFHTGECIVKLLIQEDAKRSSAFSNKCRCNKAKVLEIQNPNGSKADIEFIYSNYDRSFKYTVGEWVYPDSFDENRFEECSNGIHFFINREDAVRYRTR